MPEDTVRNTVELIAPESSGRVDHRVQRSLAGPTLVGIRRGHIGPGHLSGNRNRGQSRVLEEPTEGCEVRCRGVERCENDTPITGFGDAQQGLGRERRIGPVNQNIDVTGDVEIHDHRSRRWAARTAA